LTLPRRPLSTLFPYTTLFRSMCVAALVQLVVGIAHRLRPRLAEHHLKVDRLQALIHIAVDHAGRAGDAFPRPELDVDASTVFVLDRKSTRLNSSHLVISYAVF